MTSAQDDNPGQRLQQGVCRWYSHSSRRRKILVWRCMHSVMSGLLRREEQPTRDVDVARIHTA